MVKDCEEKYQKKVLQQEKSCFESYLEAMYATDLIFQQSNRPIGNIYENKNTF